MKIGKAGSREISRSLPERAEMQSLFRRVREQRLLTQEEISTALGVDQGQISKILRGVFVRVDGNALRVFEYVKSQLAGRSDPPPDMEVMRAELTRKLMAAWDETAEGAKALSVILEGAARLKQRRG